MSTDGPGYPGPDQPSPDWTGQPPGHQGPPDWGGAGGAPQQTNGLAIGALVSSILGFFCGIGFIVGLILGYNARSQIRASGGQQAGEGAATAAIIIGWIGIGLMLLGIVVAILFFGFAVSSSPGSPGPTFGALVASGA